MQVGLRTWKIVHVHGVVVKDSSWRMFAPALNVFPHIILLTVQARAPVKEVFYVFHFDAKVLRQ
jgi:hypothetical protein